MATWAELEAAVPDLAEAGWNLLSRGIAYLATVRPDGGPRVHPVTPIRSGDQLYVSLARTTVKHGDLRRDPRFALHALPGEDDEEFYLSGVTRQEPDPTIKRQAHEDAIFTPRDEDPLLAFDIDRCLWSRWVNVGQPDTYPERRIWRP
jgi:hypothetical protein